MGTSYSVTVVAAWELMVLLLTDWQIAHKKGLDSHGRQVAWDGRCGPVNWVIADQLAVL